MTLLLNFVSLTDFLDFISESCLQIIEIVTKTCGSQDWALWCPVCQAEPSVRPSMFCISKPVRCPRTDSSLCRVIWYYMTVFYVVLYRKLFGCLGINRLKEFLNPNYYMTKELCKHELLLRNPFYFSLITLLFSKNLKKLPILLFLTFYSKPKYD